MRLTYIYILLYLYYNVPASVMSCCVNSFIFYFIYITTLICNQHFMTCFIIYILLYLYYNKLSVSTVIAIKCIYILLYLYYNKNKEIEIQNQIQFIFYFIYITTQQRLKQQCNKLIFIFYFIYITTTSLPFLYYTILNLYSTLFILQLNSFITFGLSRIFIFYFIYITTLKNNKRRGSV